MTSEENKAIVRRLWEIASAGDLAAFSEVYAADVVYHEGSGTDRDGLEDLKAYLQAYFTAFPDLQVTVEDMVAEGDKVFSRVRLQGTNTGEMMGMPPTSKPIDIQWLMSISRIADGKIAEEWEIFNQLDMLQQLGLTD